MSKNIFFALSFANICLDLSYHLGGWSLQIETDRFIDSCAYTLYSTITTCTVKQYKSDNPRLL